MQELGAWLENMPWISEEEADKDVDAVLALAEEDPVIVEAANGKKLILMTYAYYRCLPTKGELKEVYARRAAKSKDKK